MPNIKHEFGNDEMSLLAEAENFVKSVVPPQAPDMQKKDMRTAFLSGAYALFSLEMKMASMPVDESKSMLDKLANEFKQFFTEMDMQAKLYNNSKSDFKPDLSTMKKDLG
jgi:hypothetical protein